MKVWLRRILLAVVVLAAGFGLWQAFQPVPLLVESAVVRRGDLIVSVDDDGRTRVRERYTISAPIAGRLLRTMLDPGDAVRAGDTVVAEFAPTAPALLDARSRAEAEAQVRRAEAAVAEATALAAKARASASFAAAELARRKELASSQISTPAELEQAESAERAAREAQRAAELGVQVAVHEAELARATLLEPGTDETDLPPPSQPPDDAKPQPPRRLQLRSPIHGRVLRVFEESARALPAGTPILEVGNTEVLEVVADYLTQDAVRVQPGMPVRIVGWGGEDAPGVPRRLEGRVRVIEPGGYTKISALGVEEQRVDIVVDPAGEPQAWSALGDGYRVELQIVVAEATDVLLVPAGALFRRGDAWAVYVVAEGLARLREIRIGRRNGLDAEVLAGLAAGDVVITYPSDLVSDGTPVQPR